MCVEERETESGRSDAGFGGMGETSGFDFSHTWCLDLEVDSCFDEFLGFEDAETLGTVEDDTDLDFDSSASG